MRSPRHGFTLIELLVVLVVIGILAAIATSGYFQARRRSLGAALHSDLRNLAVAQENYLAVHGDYALAIADLPITPSPGVTLAVTSANASGWGGTASHPSAIHPQCAIFHGAPGAIPAPAVSEGVIACQ